jgi:NADPH2:quinone reductase
MPGFAKTPSASTRCNGRNCRRPSPRRARCCIAIKAASLNFPDLLIVQNKYQNKPPLPFVPGSEYAGVVEAVGEGVTQLRVGQNVACLSGTGGFGSHVIAEAAHCACRCPMAFPLWTRRPSS